jgi:hypothetical protein
MRLKRLSLPTGLFDPGATPVERLGEEGRFALFVGLVRDDGSDAALACGLAVGFAGIALVADGRSRVDVGAEPK